MKAAGMLVWNGVLTLVCGFLIYQAWTANRANSSSPSGRIAPGNAAFRMAYFEMDSIAAHFDMVKELKAEMTKREDVINAELENLGKSMQQKLNYYQQQASTGSLSQEQSDAASREMRTLDDNLKSRKQALESDYSDYVLRRQNEIKSKIEQFLQAYNQKSAYTYIVSYEPGLFYYKDSAYNITQDLIDGLNTQYKAQTK